MPEFHCTTVSEHVVRRGKPHSKSWKALVLGIGPGLSSRNELQYFIAYRRDWLRKLSLRLHTSLMQFLFRTGFQSEGTVILVLLPTLSLC